MCDYPFGELCPFNIDRLSPEEYNFKVGQENAQLKKLLAENGITYERKKEVKDGRTSGQNI